MERRMRRFGIAVARMCREKDLRHPVDAVLVKQLVRCATSVCANYRAACHGKSRADFHAKIKICAHPSQEKALPMEVNGTACGISRWLFTIYDLRFEKFGERSSRGAKQAREVDREATIGLG